MSYEQLDDPIWFEGNPFIEDFDDRIFRVWDDFDEEKKFLIQWKDHDIQLLTCEGSLKLDRDYTLTDLWKIKQDFPMFENVYDSKTLYQFLLTHNFTELPRY